MNSKTSDTGQAHCLFPARFTGHTHTIGKGTFLVCSSFCGIETIARPLGELMLEDLLGREVSGGDEDP